MKISITIAQGDTEASVIIDDRRRISDVIASLHGRDIYQEIAKLSCDRLYRSV